MSLWIVFEVAEAEVSQQRSVQRLRETRSKTIIVSNSTARQTELASADPS